MRDDYRFITWFICLLLCIFSVPLICFAGSPSPRRNISLETRWGYYVMDSSKFEESVFGRKYGIIGGLKVNLELLKQFLQVGIGTGYMRENEPFYYLYNIPVEASINIRLKFSSEQIIVPYIGGGLDYSYFKQHSVSREDPNAPIVTYALHNHRSGYHINAGFQLLLNSLSPEAAQRFDKKFGINATYLTFEARYTDLTNFDSLKVNETDVSAWLYYMGLLFEF